ERGRAEDQRLGWWKGLLRADAAAEDERDLAGLGLGHERLVRRRDRRDHDGDHALGELLGAGRRPRRLPAIVLVEDLDGMAVDAAGVVHPLEEGLERVE